MFQLSLCRLQIALEDNLTNLAKSSGRPSIVIMDRGLIDAKGYMTSDIWKRVLETLPDVDSDEDCLQRYDGVVHLVTAADGAIDYYKSGLTKDDSGRAVLRRESAEEAKTLDQKMIDIWKHHPQHAIISNAESTAFDTKLKKAFEAVMKMTQQ